jgi:acyl-CoA thioesterase-2
MPEYINTIIEILDLESLGNDKFLGQNDPKYTYRLFGGQIIAQMMVASNRTIEGKTAHSFKCDFLRAGDTKVPVEYTVERIRDGKSFSTRRVNAMQHGKIITIATISYQIPEEGRNHQIEMGDFIHPDELDSMMDNWNKIKDDIPKAFKVWHTPDRPFEERSLEWINPLDQQIKKPYYTSWFKTDTKIPNDPDLHQALFAYSSDLLLMESCMLPHGSPWHTTMSASLDHCIWFHKPFKVDEWYCLIQDSPFSGSGRGFNKAVVYTEKGEVVASLAQEGLIREYKKQP